MFERNQERFFDSIINALEWHYPDKKARPFVVKLHNARHLHYDLRLQYGAFLKSWVVYDGPCLDPKEDRRAKLVSDHSIRYINSERVIPDGMYGAGPVMLWDKGFWITDQDISEALHNGYLNFRLYGEKLKGSWALTRLQTRSGHIQTEWVLRKLFDAEARSFPDVDILEQDRSVLTLRDMEGVARGMPSLVPGRRPRKQTRDPNQLLLFADDLRS